MSSFKILIWQKDDSLVITFFIFIDKNAESLVRLVGTILKNEWHSSFVGTSFLHRLFLFANDLSSVFIVVVLDN